jgi:excisionase family DNA binding protein
MDEKQNSIDKVQLLRAGEVAAELNISRAFAYRLMQQGKIRTVTIAKSRRVRPDDLREFILKHLSPEEELIRI